MKSLTMLKEVKRGILKHLYITHFQNIQIQTKISQYISQNKEDLCALWQQMV